MTEFTFLQQNEKPVRLDQFLVEQLSQHSRAQIQKLIDTGMVLVNSKEIKAGEKIKSGYKVKPGQTVTVTVPPPVPSHIEPQSIPLDIIYEDQYLAVINKPTGMVTHPGAGVFSSTLVHALMHHMQGSLSGIGGVLRPGIVHRLDKDTSGLLVIAKADQIHQHLAKQIQNKEAKRTYLAVLEGKLPALSGKVNAPIGRHPIRRTEMAIVKTGRTAETSYKALATAERGRERFTLAELSLQTGRTHQIRVHMASLNCPVVGDLVYNRKNATEKARKKFNLAGHALHAYKLSFTHPVSQEQLEFTAPVPDDMNNVIMKLFPHFDLTP